MSLLLKTGTHKYKRRWRGPDGEWDYEYDEPPGQGKFSGGALKVRKMIAGKAEQVKKQMGGFKKIGDSFYEKHYTDDKEFNRWVQVHLVKKQSGTKHELKLEIEDFIETTSKKEIATGAEKRKRKTMNRKIEKLVDRHGNEVSEWPAKAKRQLRSLRDQLSQQRKEIWGVDHDFDPISIQSEDDYLPAWKEAKKTARAYIKDVMQGAQEKVRIRTKSVGKEQAMNRPTNKVILATKAKGAMSVKKVHGNFIYTDRLGDDAHIEVAGPTPYQTTAEQLYRNAGWQSKWAIECSKEATDKYREAKWSYGGDAAQSHKASVEHELAASCNYAAAEKHDEAIKAHEAYLKHPKAKNRDKCREIINRHRKHAALHRKAWKKCEEYAKGHLEAASKQSAVEK